MTAAERLEAAKAARKLAHSTFLNRLDQVRQDVATRGLGGRIADRLGEGTRETFAEAVEMADEHRGMIAGTIAALALWFLRHPIIAWISAFIADDQEERGEADNDDQARTN